jgi:hypothetical protein
MPLILQGKYGPMWKTPTNLFSEEEKTKFPGNVW